MRLAAALLALLVIPAPRVSAQAADLGDIHRAAVDVYLRTGDITAAVTPLQRWKVQDFEQAIDAAIATGDPRRLRAAAVFHLDIAIAVAGLASGTAKVHIDLGRTALEKMADLRKGGMRIDGLDELRSTWLAVAGSTFLSIRDAQHAIPYIREALAVAPKSAHVLTVLGTAEEVDASYWNADDWQTLQQRERNVRERVVRLGRAERAYREALRIDPQYAIASIRLGRVLQLSGKRDAARQAIERGLKDARGPFPEYVGSLFLGSLLVELKDLAGASRAYERALAIAPLSQPAVVGMAHVELMSGRPDRAQAVAQDFASKNGSDSTWWAYKDGSLDLPGLSWLRDQARQ